MAKEEKSTTAKLACMSGSEVACVITDKVSVKKAERDIKKLIVLGFLAGVYISFGAILATLVGHDAKDYVGFGITKLLGGLVFAIGLVLVLVAGAELFTGNNLMLMGWLEKKFSWKKLLGKWAIVYFANFLGAVFIALLYYISDLWQADNGAVGASAVSIANSKVNLDFGAALVRGIMANWLVCLAVFMAIGAKRMSGKILACTFPVMAFVAMGFEHSVANMYFITIGLLLKGTEVGQFVENTGTDLTNLNLQGFLLNNLVPVTIGNIIGGAVFVGMAYWYLYVYKSRK
jgi:formate/nitrite transporter